MERPQRAIIVGTGGHGAIWCSQFLPPFVSEGRLQVVAAVDTHAPALLNAERSLGLPVSRCYTELEQALQENPADFCVVVTPPESHEAVVSLAVSFELDVLCEKPLADSLEGCIRLVEGAKRAGRKLGVTMSHRFDRDKLALKRELASGNYGPISYCMYRFTGDYRHFPAFGAFRHSMLDPLLLDAAIHHIDIIADLIGAPCEKVYASTWNPEWGEYTGDTQALVTLEFANGSRALYEGGITNAVALNDWGDDYIRVECRDATLVLNERTLNVFPREPRLESAAQCRRHERATLPLPTSGSWRHEWLLDQFLRWRDGGSPLLTSGEQNLRSCAILFSAIESSRTGTVQQPETLLIRAAAAAFCQAENPRLPAGVHSTGPEARRTLVIDRGVIDGTRGTAPA